MNTITKQQHRESEMNTIKTPEQSERLNRVIQAIPGRPIVGNESIWMIWNESSKVFDPFAFNYDKQEWLPLDAKPTEQAQEIVTQSEHEQELETAFKEAYVYCARAYRSNLSRLNPELATAHTMESAEAAWLASESRRLFCKEEK